MGKNRLEAFSDGVLAIILTIMVLELKVPHGDSFAALGTLLPTFVSYALSFIYIAIYWRLWVIDHVKIVCECFKQGSYITSYTSYVSI